MPSVNDNQDYQKKRSKNNEVCMTSLNSEYSYFRVMIENHVCLDDFEYFCYTYV